MIRSAALFIIGPDYHLGDLLWLTTVLADFRAKDRADYLVVSLPDRAISRILECNPFIDQLEYGDADVAREKAAARWGGALTVHDLRPVPIGVAMVRHWRRHLPWLYYRDLWMQERGQWLATFLGLGALMAHRPVLRLSDADREVASSLPDRFVALAPNVGHYKLSLLGGLWHRIKGWPEPRWAALVEALRREGYEPYTLAAAGQEPLPGTTGLIDLPIRQVAGVIERSAALVTVESGLWFIAAALDVPFVIVPWWLPRSVDWPGPTGARHARIFRDRSSVQDVLLRLNRVMDHAEI